MFDWLKRRSRTSAWQATAGGMAAWAAARGCSYKGTRDQEGFVMAPLGSEPAAWRLEWGPSHRTYLGEREVRLRAPVPLPADSHAVVLPRTLQTALEVELFSAFTDQVRTQVDDALPEEVRWLAVSPRLGATALGELRDVLGAAGDVKPWLQRWLSGPTGRLLADVATAGGAGVLPLLFTLQFGVLTLRAAMPAPDPERLAELITLFEMALSEARRCAEELGDALQSGAPDSALGAPSVPPAD